ncbi:MAG TPA: ABC transporter permease [Blastocatellia bacterium]|jgi:putative ABC transport system permease protein|nr:ABC transporter permease [Blastocatellia bacterium]
MNTILHDLRYGLRVLSKNPGFTAVAVFTLALGIGANTAIFSVVHAVLLRPLPFAQPDRLMTFLISSPDEGLRTMEWTEGLVAYFREHSQTFEGIAAYDSGTGFNLTGSGEPGRLSGTVATYDFFQLLGQQPLYGRTFLEEEDRPGNNNVTILSYNLWQRRFGGDPEIVGQSFDLNGIPTNVVGIMPRGFDFPDHTDLWIPVGLNPQTFDYWYIEPIGRLRPGVTAADAEREISTLWNDIAQQRGFGKAGSDLLFMVRPLEQLIVGEVRTPLLVLLGAVGLVLLIACANIANLLLGRAATRSREIAVRECLGASSFRIVRQLLTESVLLSLMGSGLGLVLAFSGVQVLKNLSLTEGSRIEQLHLSSISIPRIEQVQIDLRVLLFTLGLALLTGLLFGLAPALRASRVNFHEAMKEGTRSSASGSSRRLTNGFVIAQIALSLVLLVGAGLLLESFRNLQSVDPGFRAENVWVGRLELPSQQYANDAQIRQFYRQLLERVENLPGVQVAGLCQRLPFFGGGDGNVFAIEGHETMPGEQIPTTWWRDVSPGYFKAMGIPILKGRAFQNTDTETSLRVAIVDEKFARAHWPNEEPVGKRIRFSWSKDSLMTVVGVAASVKHRRLDEDSRDYVYWPVSQHVQSSMYLVARTAIKPETLTATVRSQVSALDPELPLFEVRTMEEAVSGSLSTKRLTNLLLAGFALTALLLAVVGIYGVMSLNVNNRIHEFGIRLALGAQPGAVLRLVLGQGMKLSLIGVGTGLLGALWVTDFLKSLLFQVQATDPMIFAGVAVALCLATILACYIPARRATNIEPIVALRHE